MMQSPAVRCGSESIDGFGHRIAGRHHQPDVAGRCQLDHELTQVLGGLGALSDERFGG